jgi:hypothetical protein
MRPLLFSFHKLLAEFNAEAAFSDESNVYRETPTLEAFDVCFRLLC